ncbi:MAG: GC-type dockerin domain-anchored protein [Phycisphaerales bacterium]|nr:GC-type dockerin domain-anchored protein [Phycisphaerales bacterium]
MTMYLPGDSLTMKATHPLPTGLHPLLIAALAGCAMAAPALAQDSVSAVAGLPGDAVSAYSVGATSEQINNYTVDLPLKTSSWGNRFRLGPVVKASSSTNPTWYNHLIASTVASSVMTPIGAPYRSSYLSWSTPGPGVHASRNTAPPSLAVASIPMQSFGVAFLEFSGGPDGVFGNSDDENNLIASIVSLAPQYPGRVYVSRTVAATNKTSTQSANATLGLGMIDPAGNLVALGDGVGLSGPNPISNKKTFALDTSARSAITVNMLSESGGVDTAATRIVGSSPTTQTTPTLIPSLLAGRPITLGADLANNFRYEATPNILSSTTTHLGAGVTARGTLSFSPAVFAPLGTGTRLGTAAILSRATSTTKTRGISVWSLLNNGAPSGTLRVEMPAGVGQLIDLDDSFDPSAAFGSPENQEFTNYHSQTVYRGPNGPVATTVLPGGDLLVAAAASAASAAVPAGMNNYIAVARVNATTQAVSWTLAAHTGNSAGAAGGLAKAIYGDNGADGIPGTGDAGENDGVVDATPIGLLCLASEVSPGVTTGPSLSAPAMDSSGNVYFMSGVQLRDSSAQGHRNTLALLKANLDRATNRYRLELIAELNTVLPGLNSARNYQVQFFSVADSDSIDSGTIWSSSTVPGPLAGMNAATLPYGSPLTLGALVFRARIVYDANTNGQYADPTLPGGSGTDESYNVAMLLLPARPVADVGSQGGIAPGDGRYDNNDFVVFIDAFFAGNNALADVGGQGGVTTPDGTLDNNDFIVFIDAFFNQQ